MKVSVCLASYNGERFIKRQIDSILCQLSDNDEIIISDDGSTDNTTGIILSYNDPRIKFYSNKSIDISGQPTIYKVTRNFENVLNHASGDIIFLADQDDVWIDNKVIEVLKVFETLNVDLVVHDAILIDDQDNIAANSYFRILRSKPGFIKNVIKNSYLGCCMAFKRSVLTKSLPFPKNLIAHDIWIGLMAERFGNVAFIKKVLIYFRRHELTVTMSGNKSKFSLKFKLTYRIQFVIQFIYMIIQSKLKPSILKN